MEPKARGKFLTKIVINGFSIVDEENRLILRPRGAEATAEITIEETEPNKWKVVRGSGQYAGFARGAKRGIFEDYINRWALEAVLEVGGQVTPPMLIKEEIT